MGEEDRSTRKGHDLADSDGSDWTEHVFCLREERERHSALAVLASLIVPADVTGSPIAPSFRDSPLHCHPGAWVHLLTRTMHPGLPTLGC